MMAEKGGGGAVVGGSSGARREFRISRTAEVKIGGTNVRGCFGARAGSLP